jgi:hypothetical protein
VDGDAVSSAVDHQLQEAQREAYVEKQQIKEKGFLRVMWPQLLVTLLLIALSIRLLKTYW